MRTLKACVILVSAAYLLAGCAILGFKKSDCMSTTGTVINTNDDAFAGAELVVLTQNMLHPGPSKGDDEHSRLRLDALIQELLRLDSLPDVILLQEASVTSEKRLCNVVDTLRDGLNSILSDKGISYNSVFVPANGSSIIQFYEGGAILSRYRILEFDNRVYSEQAKHKVMGIGFSESRIMVRSTLKGVNNDIDVVSTHLTNKDDERNGVSVRALQARELFMDILPERDNQNLIIVGGDFNAAPGTRTIHEAIQSGARDSWAIARPGDPGLTSYTDEPPLTRRIDYLFMVGGRWDVLDAQLFGQSPVSLEGRPEKVVQISDHIGVIGRFRIR